MEQLKHECGIALIRLLKPLDYYEKKYGTSSYALEKLYLMMEKEHNRGQEAAGIGVVKLNPKPGDEYVWRERAEGSRAIRDIFDKVFPSVEQSREKGEKMLPFTGEINMGHLRYSTTGKSGLSYVHPFLRRNNWRSRNLLMCGNFNMTNVDEIFNDIVSQGQHPRLYSDTIMLLEMLGSALDKENHRIYKELRDELEGAELAHAIEDKLDVCNILKSTAPMWDGGFTICGATGSGSAFVLRDSHGIRPAFYYMDDEIVVVASERPVIQTVMNVSINDVKELEPGEAILIERNGYVHLEQLLEKDDEQKCSFERIYFSRGSDADIYRERKKLGANLAESVLDAAGGLSCIPHTVYSFIPNTAEVAFLGLVEQTEKILDREKTRRILALNHGDKLTDAEISRILSMNVRMEKVIIKDVKLRTFISEGSTRNDLAAHVYDITYGSVAKGEDSLVVIDDSIVRGTTLKRSILEMISRLSPKNVIVVSSSPQVRYPDYYGIDMSRLEEFIAFHAAISLLRERGMQNVIDETYYKCLKALQDKAPHTENFVKAIYAPFTQDEISEKIAELVNPGDMEVKVVYQTLEGLADAVPNHHGDWYFSGDYPTEGGYRLCNRAFVNFYEGRGMMR